MLNLIAVLNSACQVAYIPHLLQCADVEIEHLDFRYSGSD